jgi:hypothetical protein
MRGWNNLQTLAVVVIVEIDVVLSPLPALIVTLFLLQSRCYRDQRRHPVRLGLFGGVGNREPLGQKIRFCRGSRIVRFCGGEQPERTQTQQCERQQIGADKPVGTDKPLVKHDFSHTDFRYILTYITHFTPPHQGHWVFDFPADLEWSALTFVDRGEAPLDIVYEYCVRDGCPDRQESAFGGYIPRDTHLPITYPIALTTAAKAKAVAFVDYVRWPIGNAAFEKYGFVTLHLAPVQNRSDIP